jgi:hypothetical protein
MSIEAMCWAIDQDLPALEKFPLLMLADSFCEAGQATEFCLSRLAKTCGMTEEECIASLKSIASKGLARFRRGFDVETDALSQYRLNLSAEDELL